MQTNSTLFLVFTAITAVGVLIQAFVMLGIFLAAAKAAKKIEALSNQLGVHLLPTLASTKELVEELVPKLRAITEDATEISARVRQQAEHVNSTVDEVVDRTRVQAERVDGMVTGVLDSVLHASTVLQNGVNAPLRRVTAVLQGVRVGLNTLRKTAPKRAAAPYTDTQHPF